MRRLLILLTLALLCGCAPKSYETVRDELPVSDPADAPFEIRAALPPDAVLSRGSETEQVYASSACGCEITLRVLVTDSLDAAVYALAGSVQPQLRRTVGQQQECQTAWCIQTAHGADVCRALCRLDGDFCYCLCLRMKAGQGAKYNGMINDLFSSFTLVSKGIGGIPPAHSPARPDSAPHTSRCRR